MRGPKPKYRIELATEDAQRLRQLVNAHKAAQALVLRAHLVLLAHMTTRTGAISRLPRRWVVRTGRSASGGAGGRKRTG